jgi:hypothetical protein
MIVGAMGAAANAYRKGWHVRSAAQDYSLPGPLGRERLNGSERRIVERLLRTVYDDYTRYAPGSGMVPESEKNRSSAYVNPRYVGAGARLADFIATGDTESLLKGLS